MIILARECGLKLELSDTPVQSLVPEPLRVRTRFCLVSTEIWSTQIHIHYDIRDLLPQATASAEEFMQQLPQYDEDLAKQLQEAEKAGEVSISKTLLYLGS